MFIISPKPKTHAVIATATTNVVGKEVSMRKWSVSDAPVFPAVSFA